MGWGDFELCVHKNKGGNRVDKMRLGKERVKKRENRQRKKNIRNKVEVTKEW